MSNESLDLKLYTMNQEIRFGAKIKQILSEINEKINDHFNPKEILSNKESTKEELEKALFYFLSQKHKEKETFYMVTKSNIIKKVEMNKLSGKIYLLPIKNNYYVSIYLGEVIDYLSPGTIETIPYFYVENTRGISFLDSISFRDLSLFRKPIAIDCLNNVGVKLVSIPSSSCIDPINLFTSLSSLTDAEIICKDKNVKINRFLLAQSSPFFFTYFTKYPSQNNIFPLDFSSTILTEYIKYLVLREVDCSSLEGFTEELLSFGSFIQDHSFVEHYCNLIWDDLDEQSQINLNEQLKFFCKNL